MTRSERSTGAEERRASWSSSPAPRRPRRSAGARDRRAGPARLHPRRDLGDPSRAVAVGRGGAPGEIRVEPGLLPERGAVLFLRNRHPPFVDRRGGLDQAFGRRRGRGAAPDRLRGRGPGSARRARATPGSPAGPGPRPARQHAWRAAPSPCRAQARPSAPAIRSRERLRLADGGRPDREQRRALFGPKALRPGLGLALDPGGEVGRLGGEARHSVRVEPQAGERGDDGRGDAQRAFRQRRAPRRRG